MHALKHSKTIFVRDYELNHEIKNLLQTDNIVTFDNYDDLAMTISQKVLPDHDHSINSNYGWNQVANDILLQLMRNKNDLHQDDLVMKLEALRKIQPVPIMWQQVSLRYSLAIRLLQIPIINMLYQTTRRVEKILGLQIISHIRKRLRI